MAIKLASAAEIAAKWAKKAAAAQGEYAAGVANPKKDWATETIASEAAMEAGIQAAIARKAFSKGVRKSGTAKQQDRSIKLGPARFAQGIAAGQGEMAANFAPFRDIIERVSPPIKGAKGDPGNLERVRAYSAPLHQAKISQG